MNNELYIQLYYTENEHGIIEKKLKTFCNDNDLILNYYRKFKSGHIPMWRELKVTGKKLGKLIDYMNKENIKSSDYNEWLNNKLKEKIK
jgi:hypothetical protein